MLLINLWATVGWISQGRLDLWPDSSFDFHTYAWIIALFVDFLVLAPELWYRGIPGLTHPRRSFGLCSLFRLILYVDICISLVDGGNLWSIWCNNYHSFLLLFAIKWWIFPVLPCLVSNKIVCPSTLICAGECFIWYSYCGWVVYFYWGGWLRVI